MPDPAPTSRFAQNVIDREIEDDPLRQRGDSVQFPVRNLFENPVGTNSYHFPVWSSDESVATARIVTDNPEIRITATGFGTTTISVSDTRADVSISFDVVVPDPTPTPEPTTEPRLLLTLNDPRGDGGKPYPPLFDLRSFSMWEPDDQGWTRIEFQTWEPVNPSNQAIRPGWAEFRFLLESTAQDGIPYLALNVGGLTDTQWQLFLSSQGSAGFEQSRIFASGRERTGRFFPLQPPAVASTFRFDVQLPPEHRGRLMLVSAMSRHFVDNDDLQQQALSESYDWVGDYGKVTLYIP